MLLFDKIKRKWGLLFRKGNNMQSQFDFIDYMPPINNVTLFDRKVLAITLYAEARGEKADYENNDKPNNPNGTHQGMWLVAWVIRNRVTQRRYNAKCYFWMDYRDILPPIRDYSFAAVCLRRKQFSCWNPIGSEAELKNHEICFGLLTDIKFFNDKLEKDRLFRDAVSIANKIDKGYKEDPVDGANLYFNPKVCNPAWDNMVVCENSMCKHQYDLDSLQTKEVVKCPKCGYSNYNRLCEDKGTFGNHKFMKEL
jgi:hypothetical protein